MIQKPPNSSKTILHLGKYYWPHPGGMETTTRQFSECGIRLGHLVICWVAQTKGMPSKIERLLEVEVHRFKSFGTFLSVPLSFSFILSKNPNIEILHLHLPHPFAELYTLMLAPRRLVLIPYFHAFPVGHGLIGKLWFFLITRPILKKAKTILVSNPQMSTLVPELRPFQDKLQVLPCPISCLTEPEVNSLIESREQNKMVLTVGRMVPYKGYRQLLRAWKIVLENNPNLRDWRLVLIGDGPESDILRTWSAENLDAKNVEFIGSCDDNEKNSFYKKATLYVLSSISNAETFGISLLEAFAAGLPAAVVNLPGGVSVLSRNGDCGLVYPAQSIDGLANALSELMHSKELRIKAGKENLRFAQEHFSEQSAETKYSEVLKNANV